MSSIIIRTKFSNSSSLSHRLSKWADYVSKKEKADSTSLDEKNLLNEFFSLASNNDYIKEKNELFIWNQDGDINPKDFIKFNKLNNINYSWNLVISFPNEFAFSNGLITKSDFFELTKNIMPNLITDMNLRLENSFWFSCLHRNTKNPHLHIFLSEKLPTATTGYISQYVLKKLKSNIANYLIDNKSFYILRDKEFSDIVGNINLKKLSKVQPQKLYSDKYRKDLNKMLLDLYNDLPQKGRLQYNSKNIKSSKNKLDNIIDFILSHESIKYNYSNYLKLLDKHQRELETLYGMSNDNINKKYYNDQIEKLYTRIGNEILQNFKIYQAMDLMEREKKFLSLHIKEMNFKSRKDYSKEETRINIAKDLYKMCTLAELNYNETKKVFQKWVNNSNYNYDVDELLSQVSSIDYEMSSTQYYKALNKLGYNYEKYNKFRNKYFYKQLNYKKFINQAMEHIEYEIEKEQKEIISSIQYEMEGF